ncbi:MAG: histidinol-phosphate transaminase [Deltaproteobacteria bacterium]|nr:MAG: histidinol-phosphate transaminase [Deltaproteobacteria bacterium]
MLRFLIPPYIEELPSYPLGRDYGEGQVRLSANENPLGPPPRAVERIKGVLGRIHRYPDGLREELLGRLSQWLGVGKGNLLLGSGSNEVIDMAVRAFLREGDEVLVPKPGYAYYRISARSRGADVREVPLRDLRLDLSGMAQAVGPRTKMIFLDNPNNPTGTIFTQGDFERFIEWVPEYVLIVIDCAYAEFVASEGYPRLGWLLTLDRPILVLRTFSKFFGLAGLRIGYGVAREELVGVLRKVHQPFNISVLALAAALGALEDLEFQRETRRVILEGKRMLEEGFREVGIEYLRSEANFFLVKVGDGKERLLELLEEGGIIVRDMRGYGLPDYIRVSIGRAEENRRFIEVLRQWARG